MRKIFLAAVVSMMTLLPTAGHAQQPAKPGDIFGLNSSQVVAIGVGVLGGVVVGEAAFIGAPVWAGALAGGLVGNWWYSQQAEEMKATAARRAAAIGDEARLYLIGINDYTAATVDTWSQWLAPRAQE